MAQMSTSGIDDLYNQLAQMGEQSNTKLIDEMLDAGADITVKAWKSAISAAIRTNRSTGATVESIGVSSKTRSAASIEVTALGKDEKGVRNAEKAFILHYGKDGQPGTRCIDTAEEKAEPAAIEKMQEILNDYFERNGL